MATDTPSPSYEETPTLMEWDSLSEEDQIKQQEDFMNFLNKPETLEKFGEACKHIGQTAVAIDEDFRAVKSGFTELVKKHGSDFPEVGSVFVRRWDGLKARWNGETGILWSSRELAANTAAVLSGESFFHYKMNLELVADIQGDDDLIDAQKELKQFVETHPIHVSNKVAENFAKLKDDVQDFSMDFTKYVEEQKQKLSEEAKKYEDEIKQLQTQISEINVKIAAAAIALACSLAIGIVDALIPLTAFISILAERMTAEQKLNTAQANLANTVRKQRALAAMQVDFEKIKPNIDDICTKLGVFAGIWSFASQQSALVNTELQEGMKVLTNKAFQAKLGLLIAQVEPLKEGMRQYAMQVVPPSNSGTKITFSEVK
ncbi:hypothetical protein AGABI1DRAFT_108038 [Agaricus bisporus var. burnettii JB137-S8]|uniref:Uncharacterized protein n=1 Tax=Agaricus bisporus var. burnettii (strain JB137-S8 / ATCC MYA-4627 / FGSC 10392) TaxID=597362 RepID=K5XRK5_AGABU|nr:uncharacterized protein AGABI1DRAFT_108038 [Agaricus bisporus var. burnettii JB137-S8]EKM77515.1 hypothetical protein AGABI1DRAFT_108038 [Agaricus bisporus var. burnettii JB137-S8]